MYYGDTLVFIPSDDGITELVVDAAKCSYGLCSVSYPLLKGLKSLEFIGNDNSGTNNAMSYESFSDMLRRNSGADAFELESFTVRGLSGTYNPFRLGDNGDEDIMEIRSADSVAFYGDNAWVSVSYPRRKVFSTLTLGDGIVSYELIEDEGDKEDGSQLIGGIKVILSESVQDGSYVLITEEYLPHFEYTFVLPWTKTEFESLEKYRAAGLSECPVFDDYSTTTHQVVPGLTLKFEAMSDDEQNAAQAAKNFEWSTQTDENGEYIRIYMYKGEASVVKIPDSINGLPVKQVNLNVYTSITPTITELHLPSSVEYFDFSRSSISSFGTVYYDGNKSDFIAMILDGQSNTQTPSLRALFDVTERIVCSDGEIVPQPAREIITFTESGGHKLTLNVNWQGGELFEITSASFTPNGQDTIDMYITGVSGGLMNISCTFVGNAEKEGEIFKTEYSVQIQLNRSVNGNSGYSEITFEYAYLYSESMGNADLSFTFVSRVPDVG